MKTNMGKLLGLSILTAMFTAGCASNEDKGAPPTVIIERERSTSPAPVIIEKDKDREVKVDVDLDKD
jgi:hypothetical protein